MNRLAGKLCVVTGAGRGIGEAVAQAFTDEGARVVVTDSDHALGSAVANRLSTQFVALDVAIEEHWNQLAARYPEIDGGLLAGSAASPATDG